MCYIVCNVDCEVLLWHGCGALGKNGKNHGRGEFLGAEAITPAEHARHGGEARRRAGGVFGDGDQYIFEQRFVIGFWLLGAVEHGQCVHVVRQGGK